MIIVIFLSVIFLFVHIFAQGFLTTRELGLQWNIGPRDEGGQVHSALAGRAARALANYRETWPAFLALAFLSGFYSTDPVLAAAGAWIWLAARLVYLPLYLGGVSCWRSVVWLVAFVGLALMAAGIFHGGGWKNATLFY